MKEALHIQMTPVEERFNREGGLEVPGCWTAVMRRQGGRSNLQGEYFRKLVGKKLLAEKTFILVCLFLHETNVSFSKTYSYRGPTVKTTDISRDSTYETENLNGVKKFFSTVLLSNLNRDSTEINRNPRTSMNS